MAITKEDILQLAFPKKLAGLGVLLALIIGLYVYLSFLPKQSEIKTLSQRIVELENEREEKKVIAEHKDEYEQAAKKLKGALDKAVLMLPSAKEIPELLLSISEMVEASGLELDVFEPQPEIPENFYAQVPVNVNVRGDFTQLAVFLDKIGKLQRIVNFQDLNVQKSDETPGAAILLKAEGRVTTYRFIQAGT